MRIAWVTHRDLQSARGGAETSDLDMISRSPAGLSIDLISPGGVDESIADYDKIVVTGFWGYSSRELNILAQHKPILWLHDTQMSGHWLNGEASKLIVLTPQHGDYEVEKLPVIRRNRIVLNPGWMDLSVLPKPLKQSERNGKALWAHRPEPHKGLNLAMDWAKEKGIELDVLVNRPRLEVLLAMRSATYFVLLSYIMDPGPRSIMEAQLLDCEIVVNDMVGYYDEDPGDLATRLSNADVAFWSTILDE